MARAWRRGHRRIEAEDIDSVSDDLLDQALYNTNPEGSYPLLHRHLERYGGEVRSLRREEYERRLPLLLRELANSGIPGEDAADERPGRDHGEGGDHGACRHPRGDRRGYHPREGETVLSFFTGGAGDFSGREAVPECLIARDDDLTAAVARYWEGVEGRFSPGAPGDMPCLPE